jgi:hypothetical protein
MLNLDEPAAITRDTVAAMGALLRLAVEGEEVGE